MAHILVIDGDDIVAELAAEILSSAGYACGWAADADEAWRLLQWRAPDLLLLDEAMPGESGATLLRRLRGSPLFMDLPVIMVTAHGGIEDKRQASFHGAQDYIRKPLQPRMLLWKVNQVLRARADGEPQRELDEWAEFQLRNDRDGTPRKVYL